MKKLNQLILLHLILLITLPSHATSAVGQTLQVSTHFTSIVGKPTWLLEIRDVQTGQVLPYLFDIKENDNFWVAFTAGRSYRVMASTVKFGPYANIKNFCHLENGILSGQSMWITLSGELSPDTRAFRCVVRQFND